MVAREEGLIPDPVKAIMPNTTLGDFMSKQLFAKHFDSDREYEEAKKEQRKQHRQFRKQRQGRKDLWQSKED